MKIFPTAQVLWALSLSLLDNLFLSTAICFLSCFFKYLFIFHLLMLLKFGLWRIVHSALTKPSDILHLPGDVRLVVSCWPLLLTCGGHHCSRHTISFRLAELIPYKSCLGDGLCCWLGRSDLHWSHVKMLPVGLLFPVAERSLQMPHTSFTPPTPLPPEDTCTMWHVKEVILCEKKKNVCTVLGIFSSGLGFERRLVTVEASIYEAHCCFLSVLHWSATGVGFSLCSSSTCRSLTAESTSTSCPECEDVHSSATLFAIVAERMQRSTVSLHHEQHPCLRWVA